MAREAVAVVTQVVAVAGGEVTVVRGAEVGTLVAAVAEKAGARGVVEERVGARGVVAT